MYPAPHLPQLDELCISFNPSFVTYPSGTISPYVNKPTTSNITFNQVESGSLGTSANVATVQSNCNSNGQSNLRSLTK